MRIKKMDNVKGNIISTSLITVMSLLIWLLTYRAVLSHEYDIANIYVLLFKKYDVYFSFNSPFIPVVDILTSHTIAYGKLLEWLVIFISFIPQTLILFGMLWDKKLLKRRIQITAVISGIFCMLFIISSILNNVYGIYKDNDIGNTIGNLNNGGKVCIQGSWIYNMRKYGIIFLSKFELFKTKVNGRKEKTLYYDDVSNINVIGRWVYFTADMEINKCYRIGTNGGQKQLISNDNISYMIVYHDYIYYINDSDDGKLYRMDLQGENRLKLFDDKVNSINFYKDFIFYGTQSGLVRMKTDCSERQYIYKGDIGSIIVTKDILFFVDQKNNDSLMRINLINGKIIDSGINNVYKFDVTDNSILYISFIEDDFNIHFSDFDGIEKGYKELSYFDFYIMRGHNFYIIKNLLFTYDQ